MNHQTREHMYDLLDVQPGRIGQPPIVGRHPHIQLRQGHLEAEIREPAEGLGKVVRHTTADKVTLEPVPVERLALVQERLRQVEVGERLVADSFDVVVVDVQLDIGCGSSGIVKL